ncbi:MAG: carboxypeptidase regulatory-like domain-containing protein [Anaerolineales bacterium]|nr:carboxypeptidase regulatory-like domain-containing protein [Anaerolineales bacterium]
MTAAKRLVYILLALILSACAPSAPPQRAPLEPTAATPVEDETTIGTQVYGRVVDGATNSPVSYAFVQAKNHRGVTVTVFSDADGNFSIPDLAADTYIVSSHSFGYLNALPQEIALITSTPVQVELSLSVAPDTRSLVSGAEWLSMLPDNTQTRQFILDCQGCHQLGWIRNVRNGWPTQDQWEVSIRKMLSFYGPQSGFPIIGPVNVEELAAWLVEYLNEDTLPPPPLPIAPEAATVRITEYDFPGAGPHDLVLDANGQVVITGMFSHNMYSLDPLTGEFTRFDLKPNANPRALEIDAKGNWWIVFGSPMQLAYMDPNTGDFDVHSIGMYAHSIAIDAQGHAWANGHFLANPGKVVAVDPRDGSQRSFDVPDNNVHNLAGLPISYDLRVDADGMIWVSELNWNRMYKLDPQTGEVAYYELPNDTSGPRRFELDAAGNLWIPQFSGGRLAMFDPRTESFTEWDVPTPNAEPYVVKVDHQRGLVWIGYAAGNRVASFDPRTERFVEYLLPTAFALIRHMAIDEASGDVWVSYHHVPTAQDKIVRLQIFS